MTLPDLVAHASVTPEPGSVAGDFAAMDAIAGHIDHAPALIGRGRRVGVAGWSIPSRDKDRFAAGETQLHRYATRLGVAEINSSFYRPHRRTTYERWAASVPDGFRFAVKLPKAITHERRLVDSADLLERFADEVGGLGARRGPVLVQLPPSLAFEATVAEPFFEVAARTLGGQLACEPRHASWFMPDANALLCLHGVARVAADPARIAGADRPGGSPGFAYFRLHGSPRIYRSDYDVPALQAWASRIAVARGAEVWTIFDNTAAGAAVANALDMAAALA